ncbi:unnamed protein product [Adineta steineri]|uniref:Replication protein A subunit n=1 Tax=Adineta steineri TaxID=433720 RepID=A0A815G1N0_9BILA|nr:unnamed protein product [Adineta steineri]CAF3586515.1 unnamed protein product [Adineta steineri]
MQKLTTGALMRFAKNNACGEQPVLQVLNIKLMDSKPVNESSMVTSSQNKKIQRYRLILSDGKYFLPSCVLTVQLNELVLNGQLQEYSIIRLDRYLRSDLKGQTAKMILQILQLTVLDITTHKIGNPVSLLTADLNENDSSTITTTKDVLQPKVTGSVLKRPIVAITNEQPVLPPLQSTITITKMDIDSIKTNRLFKIETLNPFQNRWTIQVRVAYKKPVRAFSNGEGRLFSCDLIDETGEIRATGFGDECDRFEPMLIVGNIYYITQAQIKYANKQFNTLNNDFEMTFNNETIIETCIDNISSIPIQHLHFISIDQIQNMENNSFIDVIGIVMNINDIVHGKSKQNKDYTKRDILILDQTGQIIVTLWYQMAENFPMSSIRTIIMLKGVCVNDFNGGRTLSVLGSTQLTIDPDLPLAHDLRRWYLEEGMNIEMTDLTVQSTNQETIPWKTFAQVTEYGTNVSSTGTGELCRVKGVCIHVRHDPVYKACTRIDCKKKLQENNDGTYYCSKCDLHYEDYKLLYMASILLSDSTGHQWVNFFEKESEILFGFPAEQFPIGKTKDDEDKAYQKLISICGEEKLFLIRVKSTRYNNHDRLQFTCVGVESVDAHLMCRLYLEDIGRMCRLSSN